MLKQLIALCLLAIVSVQACSTTKDCPAESLCTHAFTEDGKDVGKCVTFAEIEKLEAEDDDKDDERNNFSDLKSLVKKGWKLTKDVACKGTGCQQMCQTLKHEATIKSCRCKPGYTLDPADATETACIPVPVCEKFCVQEFKKASNNLAATVLCTDSCNNARHSLDGKGCGADEEISDKLKAAYWTGCSFGNGIKGFNKCKDYCSDNIVFKQANKILNKLSFVGRFILRAKRKVCLNSCRDYVHMYKLPSSISKRISCHRVLCGAKIIGDGAEACNKGCAFAKGTVVGASIRDAQLGKGGTLDDGLYGWMTGLEQVYDVPYTIIRNGKKIVVDKVKEGVVAVWGRMGKVNRFFKGGLEKIGKWGDKIVDKINGEDDEVIPGDVIDDKGDKITKE